MNRQEGRKNKPPRREERQEERKKFLNNPFLRVLPAFAVPLFPRLIFSNM
jgi:hypothetical protein